MKIPFWMNIPIIKNTFLKNKAIVYQRMPHGKVETHAYTINQENELEVYSGDAMNEKKLYNPIVKGKPTYDDDGRLIFSWVYGEPFAYSLFTGKNFEQHLSLDVKVEQALTTGIAIGMNRAKGGRKSPWEDPVMMAIVFVVIITAVNAFMVYSGFNAHGVDIFGGTAGA